MSTTKRQLARPGLSYVQANNGRLVTYSEDVLGIKRRIEDRWPDELSVVFDDVDEVWCVIEHCRDGVDRLVFDTPCLNESAYQRLERAFERTPDQMLAEIDRHNKAVEQEMDRKFEDRMGDAAERLWWALRKDGVTHYPKVFFNGRSGSEDGP